MSFLNEAWLKYQVPSQMRVNLGICEVWLLIWLLTDWQKKKGNEYKKYRPERRILFGEAEGEQFLPFFSAALIYRSFFFFRDNYTRVFIAYYYREASFT